eukprot:5029165-Prorocentrum_lima.AAC.1
MQPIMPEPVAKLWEPFKAALGSLLQEKMAVPAGNKPSDPPPDAAMAPADKEAEVKTREAALQELLDEEDQKSLSAEQKAYLQQLKDRAAGKARRTG